MTTTPTVTPTPTPAQTDPEPGKAVANAVDLYDAVAHLESMGMGDAAARKAGHKDAFEHATVLRERMKSGVLVHAPSPFPALHVTLADAAERVFIMLAGVIFCLTTFPKDVSEDLVFAAGATGWLAGQVISAGMWKALGTGSRRATASIAVRAAIGLLICGIGCSLIIGAGSVLLWVTWACAASSIVILSDKTRTRQRLARCAFLGVAAVAALVAPYGQIVATVAILVMWMQAVIIVLEEMRAPKERADVQPAAVMTLAVIQTLSQVLVLWCFMRLMGGAVFAAMAVAGLVAGAVSDLILEFGHDRVKRIAHYQTDWHSGRRKMTLVGLMTVALIVMATNITVIVLSIISGGFEANGVMLITAATMVGALTTGTGLLLRSASAEGAAAFASTAAVLTLCVIVLNPYYPHLLAFTLPLATGIVLILAAAIAAQRFTHPSTW